LLHVLIKNQQPTLCLCHHFAPELVESTYESPFESQELGCVGSYNCCSAENKTIHHLCSFKCKKTVQQEPLTFFFKRLATFLYLLEGSVTITKSG